ncbi:MAG: tyrosine-type recombinase/integrase [Spirochaetaceae bacterium]
MRWAREFLRRGAVAAVRHDWYWVDRKRRKKSTDDTMEEEVACEAESYCGSNISLTVRSKALGWVRRLLRFHHGTLPKNQGTPEEIASIITGIEEPYSTIVRLTYAAGLRLNESLQIRIMDLGFEDETAMIRSARGEKERARRLPEPLHEKLPRQMARGRTLFDEDRRVGNPGVPLPDALAAKYPAVPRSPARGRLRR